MAKRSRRKLAPKKGYRPAGEPVGYWPSFGRGGYASSPEGGGYVPQRRTRKAPKAYWCRFPDGYGKKKEAE